MAINLNRTLPAAPAGSVNVKFQSDVSGNVSGYVPGSASIQPGIDTTGLTADVATATLLAVTATGMYRVTGYIVETTADGASSTLPTIDISWTDSDTGVSITRSITATQAGNTIGTYDLGECSINALTANDISYETNGYVSGTPATMTYAIHLTVEQLF